MKTYSPLPFYVSVLYREPKLLKDVKCYIPIREQAVSVLYREPKLLKAEGLECGEWETSEFQCSTVSRNC